MNQLSKLPLILLLWLATQVSAEEKPNVIIIFADDMGYGEVQALNRQRGKIPTPNLDELAKNGMSFTDAHTTSSVCTPSRYGLLTGRYCWRTRHQSGVVQGGKPCLIAPNRKTLGHLFREQGYSTAIFGKWHLDYQYRIPNELTDKPKSKRTQTLLVADYPVGTRIVDGPLTRGFDTFYGFHHSRAISSTVLNDAIDRETESIDVLPDLTRKVVEHINVKAKDSKEGKPFFIYFPMSSPHSPVVPSSEWQGKTGLGNHPDFVAQTDGSVGAVMRALKENDLSENTIVIFTSDNGTSQGTAKAKQLEELGHFCSGDLRGYKSDLWEGGHRVPFLVQWPSRIEAGTESTQLVCVSDLMATFAEMFGAKLADDTAEDSISFFPELIGESISSPRQSIIHHSISGRFSIRKGNWKLLLAPGSGGWTLKDSVAATRDLPKLQLYRIDRDLGETTNLADQFPEKVTELVDLLKTHVELGRSTPGETQKNDSKVDIWKRHRDKDAKDRNLAPANKVAVPNIIVIYTDDQGYGDVSALNPKAKFETPNMDRLAREGIAFTNGHSADSVCTPSRYALLTGRYAWRTRMKRGVMGAEGKCLIENGRMTIASMLRANGYNTAMVGKWHLGMDFPGKRGSRDWTKPVQDMPLDKGFEYFYGIPASLNYGILAWFENRHAEVPPTQFTNKKPNARHSDYRIMPPYDESSEATQRRLNKKGWEVAPDFIDNQCLTRFTDKAIEWMSQQVDDSKAGKPFFLYLPYTSPHFPICPLPEFQGQGDCGAYGEFLIETDNHIGRILKFLKEKGIDDNTLIVFSSDNGPEKPWKAHLEEFGHDSRGGFREGKRSVYEGGHRVPFLIRWPNGIKSPGRTWDAPVGQVDLLATLADLVGAKLPDNAGEDSESFASVLSKENSKYVRAPLVAHGNGGRYAIIESNWKMISPSKNFPNPELYDLSVDASESNNVATAHPLRVNALQEQLTTLVVSGRSTPGIAQPNDTSYWKELYWIKSSEYERRVSELQNSSWVIDSDQDWKENTQSQSGLEFKKGVARPSNRTATFTSTIHSFDKKRQANSIVIAQSPEWLNWNPIANIGPSNLNDAPVMLQIGPDNYWMFGRYGRVDKNDKSSNKKFEPKSATLEGFQIPLMTTRFPNQFDAKGGLKKGLGGYHAWQSKDMKNWVHHGPITESFSKWMTTAEFVDGKAYFYYDFPNDQDPHVYVDSDLFDGVPGVNKGIAYDDPTHGSDCAIIRDLDGQFHIIVEDWSPINAKTHSWDSPLAARAVSPNGIKQFKTMNPPVDDRTQPTGKTATYRHPHWVKEHPKRFKSNVAEYEVHEPEQNAYGDWAAISIGGQYYLFCDFDPKDSKQMSVGWFTANSIDSTFEWCGNIGKGHPDPDVMFAEGRFYLATQQSRDFTSPGPWVEDVQVRVGVDVDNDKKIDEWTEWKTIREKYDYVKGFSKQVAKTPASLDLSSLPNGFGFQFEIKLTDSTGNESTPTLDRVEVSFDRE